MPRVDTFLKYYRQLNPAQKLAVDTIEGPVMVVAGPGTGKTQILTLRIANILRQTDTPPDAILALTFTQSAAASMRERLVEIIGHAAYRVNINTFHGFCNELILNFPEEFPRLVGAQNATRVDQVRILEGVISEAKNLKLLRPFGEPFHHLRDILAAIERLKKENIKPAEFKKIVVEQEKKLKPAKTKKVYLTDQKAIQKNKELAELYFAYEDQLREERLYDFSDMIMEVIEILETNPNFLLTLQEEYQYILADEHQDANNSQNRLLELLSNFHSEPNLFIVGDEKQAIFQFQGASLDNFAYFRRLYPKAKLIKLEFNYRSPQAVLDAAQSLIEKSGLAADLISPLVAKNSLPNKFISVFGFDNPEYQHRFLADEIKLKIKSGAEADKIAVLYRDNSDARPAAEALERAGIPFVIQSESDVLADPEIHKFITLLRAIYFFGQDEWLFQVLHLDFMAADSLEIYKLAEAKRRSPDHSAYALLAKLKNKNQLAKIYRQLDEWHRQSFNLNLVDLFGAVLDESGFKSHILQQLDAPEKLAKLQSLYEEIKEATSRDRQFKLGNFVDYLARLEKHKLSLSQSVSSGLSGVRLMTVHRAKGLEFDYVYLIDAYDGHFGNRRQRGTFRLPWRGAAPGDSDDNDDERRLFYVALTRAKREATILYPRRKGERVLLPSQFIAEIDSKLLRLVETGELEKKYAAAPPVWLAPKPALPRPLTEKSYLNKLFLERGLSVTDLNNYLDCPLKYFYQNLLRITEIQNKHLMFGTAMHATLRDFFDHYREAERWGKREISTRFKYHLSREPLSAGDFKETLAKGKRALAGYLDWYKYSWPERIINEFKIRGILLAPEVRLNGRIDKLELPASGWEVRVVDYKTGKPKTRNFILGETKTGGGNYLRQLVFYKLLLDNFDGGKYQVVSGLIDFLEPDEKGRYHREEFAITPEQVVELKELVLKVAQEILNLEFFNKGCGKPDCEACKLYALTDPHPK